MGVGESRSDGGWGPKNGLKVSGSSKLSVGSPIEGRQNHAQGQGVNLQKLGGPRGRAR